MTRETSVYPGTKQPLIPYGEVVVVVNNEKMARELWVQTSKDAYNPRYIPMEDLLVDVLHEFISDMDRAREFAKVLLWTKEKKRWEYFQGYFEFDDVMFDENNWPPRD